VISDVTESHRSWRLGSARAQVARKSRLPTGTVFALSLNEAARVTLTFTRTARGLRVDGKCAAIASARRHPATCTRHLLAGTLSFAGHAARNTVTFQGRLSSTEELGPGRYAMTITATTARGGSATAPPLRFMILENPTSGGTRM
jgi:hypothetical protein